MLKRIASLNILNMSPSPSPANPALSAVLDGDDTAVEQSHAGEAGAGAAPPDTDAVEGKSRRLRRLLISTPTEERFCSISRASVRSQTQLVLLLHCCIRQHRRCSSTPRTHIMLAQRWPSLFHAHRHPRGSFVLSRPSPSTVSMLKTRGCTSQPTMWRG